MLKFQHYPCAVSLKMEAAPITRLGADVSESRSKTNGLDTESTHEEYQYLDLIREILAKGEHRPDRFIDPVKLSRKYNHRQQIDCSAGPAQELSHFSPLPPFAFPFPVRQIPQTPPHHQFLFSPF